MELCLEKLKVELVSGDPPMTWMCLHMRHRAFIVIGSNKTKKDRYNLHNLSSFQELV